MDEFERHRRGAGEQAGAGKVLSDGFFSGIRLHPEAKDLFSLVNYPELIEARYSTSRELQRMLQKSGYREENICEVTVGWGGKIGSDFAAASTMAIIVFKAEPEVIYSLTLGSAGAYHLAPLFQPNSTREALNEDLKYGRALYRQASFSSKAQQLLQDRWQINLEESLA